MNPTSVCVGRGSLRAAAWPLLLCVAAGLLAAAGAWPASAWAQAAGGPVPAPPAFHTQSPSRVRDIQGDSFVFSPSEGKSFRVRLIDADCQPLGEAAAKQAAAVATNLLEGAPFWVFPAGQNKGPTTDEVWADVWTEKGWLSAVLIRAGYAQRRTEPAPASLSPFDLSGTSNKGPAPAAPAFLASACTPQGGDTLEVETGGKKFTVRLFDATCEGASGDQRNEADAAATRLAAKGGVWVFPCAPLQGGKAVTPARIWTAEGFLGDILVKAGCAQRGETPDRAAAQAAAAKAAPTAAPKPAPARKPEKTEKPAEPTFDWQPISVTLTQHRRSSGVGSQYSRMMGAMAGSMNLLDAASGNLESNVFKISSGVWRVTWEAKQGDKGSRATISVMRCGGNAPDATSKTPSAQVASYTTPTGVQILRTMPGNYWVRVSGVADCTVKVEEAVPRKPVD